MMNIQESARLTVAAAAKALQLCLTLHDPMDRNPPGSSVHEIFQARVLEWAAIAFSMCYKYKINKDFPDSSCWILVT